ncbi:MAG TPA: hypothetical protein PK771_06005 [Spirochaetota bacterium]|nr:hypothetical protein [Spirochaetota bacterium]
MPILVKVSNKETSLNGEYQAVISQIYDVGLQPNNFGDNKDPIHKVIILWELDHKFQGKDGREFRLTLTKEYSLNLGKRSTLRKDLELLFGENYFDDKDGIDIDLEKIRGVNCILTVEEKKGKDNKDYPNIIGIRPLPKETLKMKPELKDDFIPDWISKKMGVGYQNAFNPTGSDELPF